MTRTRILVALVLGLVSAVVGTVALPTASAQDSGEGTVLRVGWFQDPKTLNPFTGLDEESFTIWAINWDLLVNFDPQDLSPAPGIAKSWEVSEDRKTTTFELDPERKWSDGVPITSADVKWSLETLGSEGTYFTGYTSNIERIRTPDKYTVVVETKQPDARIVGGLFIYILPKHVWAKTPVDDLTGAYEPKIPLVGSGPYTVAEFDRAKIVRMERNPEFEGDVPYDEVQFIKYGNGDAAERALELGEVDFMPEIEAASFERLDAKENITALNSPTPSYTELAFNLCPAIRCPDANRNDAILDPAVRQATAYAVDRQRLVEIATRDTAFVANGILPSFYKSFYEDPEQTYPYDPDMANQLLDDAGWVLGDDGVRTKDGERLSFNLYARSESQYTIQMANLIAEQAAEVGIEYDVQVVSTDKLTDLTIRKVDGKPAPDFDTFIWGWGGDPYDPSFLLSILTSGEIGGSSDSFYSNPEYDKLMKQQAGLFDVDERRAVIQQMVAMTQEDLPYLVLTEDPNLQAYRDDRIEEIEPVCPAETGDLICDQVSYEGILALNPIEGASSGADSGSGSAGLAGLIGLLIGFLGGVLVTRSRRGDADEPLELPE